MFSSKSLHTFLGIFFLSFLMIAGYTWALSKSLPTQDYAEIIKSLKMRSIGPAIMGGRVVDFAVVESNPAVIYVVSLNPKTAV